MINILSRLVQLNNSIDNTIYQLIQHVSLIDVLVGETASKAGIQTDFNNWTQTNSDAAFFALWKIVLNICKT